MKVRLFAPALIAMPLMAFVALKTQPLEPSSTLKVEGGSTVRGWACSAKSIEAAVAVQENAPVASLVKGATVTIPVEQLDCGNGTMNEHMRKALKAEQNKTIVFKLEDYTLSGSTAQLNGDLTISGQTQKIQIPATVLEEGSAVRVKATKSINMTQWGVKPPSLMLGTMKVKPDVTVTFDVTLKK